MESHQPAVVFASVRWEPDNGELSKNNGDISRNDGDTTPCRQGNMARKLFNGVMLSCEEASLLFKSALFLVVTIILGSAAFCVYVFLFSGQGEISQPNQTVSPLRLGESLLPISLEAPSTIATSSPDQTPKTSLPPTSQPSSSQTLLSQTPERQAQKSQPPERNAHAGQTQTSQEPTTSISVSQPSLSGAQMSQAPTSPMSHEPSTENPSLAPSQVERGPRMPQSDTSLLAPSRKPTILPSGHQSEIPSTLPSTMPYSNPSTGPSMSQSNTSSGEPSRKPTMAPSSHQSEIPSTLPITMPSNNPSTGPTMSRSNTPSVEPSRKPTVAPSFNPSASPSEIPSARPSTTPSSSPSSVPSTQPTLFLAPSTYPTVFPTQQPSTSSPTVTWSSPPSPRPTSAPTNGPFVFYVMGDTPYDSKDRELLKLQIANVPNDGRFMVHVGDMNKASRTKCDESYFRDVNEILRKSPSPVLIMPGDNDIIDCPNVKKARKQWDKYFGNLESNWEHDLPIQRFERDPINFAFFVDGILFLSLDMVSPSNDDEHDEEEEEKDEFFAADLGRTVSFDTNLHWSNTMFDEYGDRMEGLVIFSHAAPHTDRDERTFDRVAEKIEEIGVPTVLIHGNGHKWKWDERAFGVPNMLRVQLDKGEIAAPTKVVIDWSKPELFDFVRRRD